MLGYGERLGNALLGSLHPAAVLDLVVELVPSHFSKVDELLDKISVLLRHGFHYNLQLAPQVLFCFSLSTSSYRLSGSLMYLA